MAPKASLSSDTSASPPPPTPTAAEWESFEKNQSALPRLTLAEEARTILASAKMGHLATMENQGPSAGFPSGALVDYAVNPTTGLPVVSLTTLSAHARHLAADDRVSLTVGTSLASARVTITGRMSKVPDADAAQVREHGWLVSTRTHTHTLSLSLCFSVSLCVSLSLFLWIYLLNNPPCRCARPIWRRIPTRRGWTGVIFPSTA